MSSSGETSRSWYRRAVEVMPGGVNSPVRAFKAVGGTPPFVASASGARLSTVDGVELIDFICSWGALILGHAEPAVVAAVEEAARKGTSYGIPTPGEVELAELVVEMVPSIEIMRLVNSGTEATASAIRLARAASGKPGIVKFEGCYHGHADPFLVRAGSGAATLGEPDSPGVPPATLADTRIARFNDLESVERAFGGGGVAAVIVEPVAGNMGVVPPLPGFLEGLRRLCDEHGALLVFDEVMTGFRVARGGAQLRYDVEPDLTCLGKVISGGTPAAGYGGRRDLMRRVAPDGPVYQAGTLAGNPLAVAAGLATLRHIAEHPELYDELETMGARLESGLSSALRAQGIPGCVQRVGGMLTLFFGPESVTSWEDAEKVDRDRFTRFFAAAYREGVLLPPSPFEALFLMRSQSEVIDDAIDILVKAVEEAG
ncbi:MAG TPA: glutamate-1-semialdehyde 2,1-aminomutase [Acidimicrobiia bacterium]|nr:glutamate-1-semialdehyde 2,1-aminomutase [Acidimicrobiia bacterium]